MSNIRKTVVSNSEKKFLVKNLTEWTRLDGRAFHEFREVKIEFGKDWGCCYVSLGKTKVLAQVSSEIQQPKSSRPSEGILNINLELNPIAAPHFEAGRQSDLAVQLNRLLEKCLKDSKAIDLESLCIKMNERVWAIRVDVNVLNHEGNILDCASLAALAALAHFRRPDVTCDGEEFIIHSYKQRDPIGMVIHHYPVCITYSVFSGGDYILADPSLLEENVADAFLSIGVNAYKELCGLHLGGKADLSPDLILKTGNKAATRAAIVVQQIKDAIERDNQKRMTKDELGFHKTIMGDIEIPLQDLTICLDEWASKDKKSKKKKKNKGEKTKPCEKMEASEDTECINENPTAEVKSLGKSIATLIPKEDENAKWEASDSENNDDDVVYVETPKPLVNLVFDDSDSEEDAVIVLNADQKTNKKKKMKK